MPSTQFLRPAQFATYQDEEKGDTKKGDHVFYAKGTPQTAMVRASFGKDAYILSFSTILSQELMNRFGGSAALEVRDTINFTAVIGRRLPGWRQGFEGFCDYEDGPIVRDIGPFSIDDLKEKEQNPGPSIDKMGQFAMGLADPAVFFRKQLKYQSQKRVPIRLDSGQGCAPTTHC